MGTNSISTVTPETVQAQFNAWYAVAIIIGGVIWHSLLKLWPVLKTIYPWIKANRGIGPIILAFFYVPRPKTTDIQTSKS